MRCVYGKNQTAAFNIEHQHNTHKATSNSWGIGLTSSIWNCERRQQRSVGTISVTGNGSLSRHARLGHFQLFPSTWSVGQHHPSTILCTFRSMLSQISWLLFTSYNAVCAVVCDRQSHILYSYMRLPPPRPKTHLFIPPASPATRNNTISRFFNLFCSFTETIIWLLNHFN